MFAFFTSRRKILLTLLFVLLLLSGCLIVRLSSLSSPYMLVPNKWRLPIADTTVSFRTPYQGETSSVNVAPYSHENAFRPDQAYARLHILRMQVVEIDTTYSTGETLSGHPYLIVEAKVEKIFYQPSTVSLSEGDHILLHAIYIPNESSLSCMIPKVELNRSYYIGFSPLKPKENPKTETYITEYKVLSKLSSYAFSPTIYNCMPITDEGTVVMCDAMKLHPETAFTQALALTTSYTQTQSTLVEAFEVYYRDLIERYCDSVIAAP